MATEFLRRAILTDVVGRIGEVPDRQPYQLGALASAHCLTLLTRAGECPRDFCLGRFIARHSADAFHGHAASAHGGIVASGDQVRVRVADQLQCMPESLGNIER